METSFLFKIFFNLFNEHLLSPETKQIIKLGGKPNVDEGELKKELCFELNTFGPLRVSNLCKTKNINYIHISSGCIYTGYDKCWEEDDEPNTLEI